MKILDETGKEWAVRGGDPCSKAMNLLKRRGYELLVLPVSVLARGERPRELHEIESVTLNVRYKECLQVLERDLWK